ncbi:hypothetical protein PAD3_1785 [Pediococcus acidilactici D3]|nr:hypothetical protein PAD3_1785 [Pediococcus acidilactici D3]
MTGSNIKTETSQNDIQNSQSLSIANSVADSVKQSQSLVADKQSLSISQSMVASMSKSTEKITSKSGDPEAPIQHENQYLDEKTGASLLPTVDDYRDTEDALKISAPPTIPGYILDITRIDMAFQLAGAHRPSSQAMVDYLAEFRKYAATGAGSIDDLNAWIRNSDFYKQYLDGSDPDVTLVSLRVKWLFKEHDSELNLVGHDVETSVGNPLEPKDAVTSITNADGTHPNLDEDIPGLSWKGYINWNQRGDYDVTLVYYDANSLQTVYQPIVVRVTSNIALDVKDGQTYVGYPKDISDFVNQITDGSGNDISPTDPNTKLQWGMRDSWWDEANVYKNIEITYTDSKTGETITKTVTITVLRNQEDIKGEGTTYTIGDKHPTINDLKPSAHKANGDLDTDATHFKTDMEGEVKWDTPGTYDVEISYYDDVTKGTITTTVKVTVVAQEDKISIDGEGTQVKVGDKPTLKDLNARATDHNGNEVDINDIDSDIDKIDWNKPGEHDVVLTYTDNGETVTKVVTVTVVSDQALSVQDSVDTWEGQPLNPQDVVTGLTDSHGDVDNDLTNAWWKFDDKNWDKPDTYTVTVYYTDKYGNTVSKDVTIVVKEDKTSIDGSNYETTTGNIPTLSDVNASATDANGDPVDLSEIKATVEDTPWDDVDWSVPGTYVVTLTYTDPTTGKTVTKTVTVTIKDDVNSISQSESNADSVSKSGSDSVSKSTSGSDSISGSGSDSISKSTSDSISKSTSGSDSISGSGSDSISKSTSDSISKSTSGSDSISGSGSDSISKSTSDSVSKSTSGSDSISGSGSDSISKSTSDSISKSTSGSDSISGSGSDSISKSTSDSISKSTSGSDSISGSGSDSISKSTSDSVSKSTSGSDSISGSGSDSISKSTSDSISKSTSGSDSISGSGSDSISKSTSDSRYSNQNLSHCSSRRYRSQSQNRCWIRRYSNQSSIHC